MKATLHPARLAAVSALLAALGIAGAPAWGAEVSGDASEEAFRAFHRRFSAGAYAYPGHGAKPLGITGFEVYVDLAADTGFGDDPSIAPALDGDLTADALIVARVGARKGLPGGFDIGASYARALDGDFELFSGALQWAVLKGTAVTPAFALRGTYTKTLEAGTYDLDQIGVEALVSKGFAVVTPYAGAGLVRSEGTLATTGGGRFTASTTQVVAYAGITVRLLLPKLNFEVQKGEDLTASARLSFGF